MTLTRAVTLLTGLAALIVLAGCGSSSPSGSSGPKVLPARTFTLARFEPSTPVVAGRTTLLSFTIRTPNGTALTAYKSCCEPHAGVDLIIVRSDDSHVQYDDTDIAANGKISQPVVFPASGRYRIVVDAYPKQTGVAGSLFNFQLFTWVIVRGRYHPQPLPAFAPTQIVDGYHFQIQGHPHLKAIQANFLTIHVTDPNGHKTAFTTWRGAYAHAIFFRAHSLDYFHTHVCSPHSRYCFSVLGGARVTGRSTRPGVLKVGVLLPASGTWRMFLLTYLHGHILTAPFTLQAS